MELAYLNADGEVCRIVKSLVCVTKSRFTRWPNSIDIQTPGRYIPIVQDGVIVIYPVGTRTDVVRQSLETVLTALTSIKSTESN